MQPDKSAETGLTTVNVEIHLIRHMKTGKAEGFDDSLRTPNEEGKKQVTILRQALDDEGTEFDIVFFSPSNRTYCLALAVSNPRTILIEVPEMYDPDPKSTDPNEVIDATVLLKATELYGYDLSGWYSNSLVVDAFERRAVAVVRKFDAEVEKYAPAIQARYGDNPHIVKVAFVGHFLYLNVLCATLCDEEGQEIHRHAARTEILGECGRFIITTAKVTEERREFCLSSQTIGDESVNLFYLPLGQKFPSLDAGVPD